MHMEMGRKRQNLYYPSPPRVISRLILVVFKQNWLFFSYESQLKVRDLWQSRDEEKGFEHTGFTLDLVKAKSKQRE